MRKDSSVSQEIKQENKRLREGTVVGNAHGSIIYRGEQK